VLQSCRSTTLDINVLVVASFPKVEIDGNAANLTLAADSGHYSGTVPITLTTAGDVIVKVFTPNDEEGAVDTAALTLLIPAAITAASFTGGYPGVQTEVAEGQTYDLTVTGDKSFNRILVADLDAGDGNGAGGDQLIDVTPGTGPTVVSITIADRGTTPQLLPAHVRIRDTATGAISASRSTNELAGGVDGTDVVNLNDQYPITDSIGKGGATGHAFSIDYNPSSGQGALKGAETARVTAPVSFFDTIVYSAPGSELDVTPTGVYSDPKDVIRVGGSYNVSVDNFRITANRTANGTQTIVQGVVRIANVVPTAGIATPTRMRSGGNDGTSAQDHQVTITANQLLLSAPSVDADSGGTSRGVFQGGGFTGSGTTWNRDLRVDETIPDEKGVFTFSNLSVTGLAGLVGTVITSGASYTLGGFVSRNLTFSVPFSPNTTLNTEVVDFSKLTAVDLTGSAGPTAIKQSIGTPPPVVDGYTIDALGINPTTVIWLDTVAVGNNSTGTARIDGIEETI
jgi:hypothetical protein